MAVQRRRIVLRQDKDLRDLELMQFETGTSISRYVPPSGTAGFDRSLRQRKQPRTRTAAEDHRNYIVVLPHI